MARVTARRVQLFDQLVALFLDEGFAHLTLDEIAARLHCSKSTLYTVAAGKDDLVRAVTVHFFRTATDAVEDAVAAHADPLQQVSAYLEAVGDQLSAASHQFMEDLAASTSARQVYEKNTSIAASRVREMIVRGVDAGAFREVHASFVADAASNTMVRIQQRDVYKATGLDDAQAYRELAALITTGIAATGAPLPSTT
ncbi:TetR/AcrR family transcriptional regulator [Rhodococcus sp. ACPA4]|uniref:TetR family transcriptional regulator n=1 Tax=Nocardia globerula TaxID=1818 RepID=A0A652YX69_NOCGL|nr:MULTISPECIES: TetR/AcrR family transcriptional regulator [Rhodococcus]MCE4263219.1 TetR/AcrR family transcriptional regulator [Rhodococcus globerulus]NMD59358.1 TetR/AcrR family transcriptional regulator [Nocardia globerula]PBC41937.1 TetR/AcrR family transcriptional regulator [Rhodococcus sp. ACPA4]PVX64571.1 TetR family transcriptional regulator [Rhodococcus globerulus]